MTSTSFNLSQAATLDNDTFHLRKYILSGNSPRSGGKLMFRQNTLSTSIVRIFGQSRPYYFNSTGSLVSENQYSNADQLTLFFQTESEKISAKDDADERLRSKYYSMSANLLDIFRTRQETVNMVTSRVQKLYRGARAIKQLNFAKARAIFGNPHRRLKLGKSFPQNWLEFQYGWRPLLGDINTLLDNPLPQLIGFITARGSLPISVTDMNAQSSYWRLRQIQGTSTAFSRGKVTVNSSALSAASQLGLLNPLAVAWEAVPWSFVIDWFYPVGDYLERLGASTGITFSDYSCTQHRKGTVTFTTVNTAPRKYGGRPNQTISGFCKRSSRNMSFTLNPLPVLGNGLNLTRFANALSLLAGVFGRPRRGN